MPLIRLVLRNFQRHAKLVLPLDPKVTTIVGDTDSGKSAVLRALRWVCRNKPNGSEFLRHGEKACLVSVWAGERRISRKKGKVNSYLVDGKELRAFGNEVPAPVRQLLKTEDINFQLQHDGPFWFSLSSGELARNLNEIVDLSKIDDIHKQIKTGQNQAKAEVKIRKENRRRLKAEIIGMRPVELFLEELSVLEKTEQRLSDLRSNYSDLCEWLESSGPVFAWASKNVPDTESLRTTYVELETLNTRRARLRSIVNQVETAAIEADARKTTFLTAEETFHKQTQGQRCPICHQTIQ